MNKVGIMNIWYIILINILFIVVVFKVWLLLVFMFMVNIKGNRLIIMVNEVIRIGWRWVFVFNMVV